MSALAVAAAVATTAVVICPIVAQPASAQEPGWARTDLRGGQRVPELAVEVSPASPRAGSRLVVRVKSPTAVRAVRVCLQPGVGHPRCASSRLGRRRAARAAFPAPYPGLWTVTATAGTVSVSHALRVRPRARELVVLVAGDSLARNIASAMKSRRTLGVEVHGDINPGRALTKPDGFDWLRHAGEAIARWQPDVVAVFVGANDGWPIGSVSCCASDWVNLLAARQRAVMDGYGSGAAARVYWSTLWAPGPPAASREPVWAAENAALVTAVATDSAQIFDAAALISPGFVFSASLMWHGVATTVRDPDGIHLTRAGGRVVAETFLERLRADRILR